MPDRELAISHPIGETGRFRLTSASGAVRVDGWDGDEVHVLARYRAPAGVEPRGDPAQDGVIEVVRGDGELQVAVRDAGSSGVLASLTRLVGHHRPEVDFQVRLPRTASLRLEGVSCDVKVRELRGDQEIHTVSGDLELRDAGGRIRVVTVSGDVAISGDVLSLAATTTSGDLGVEAELMKQLTVKSVSGDVSVRSALGREVGHTFESVSGDLHLATPNGLAVEVTGVSGAVRSDLPMRREQRDGRRTTVIGDGAVRVRVRTVSGDVIVSGPGGRAEHARGADPFGVEAAAVDQLTILRLLESGQIDVDEAARRLEALT